MNQFIRILYIFSFTCLLLLFGCSDKKQEKQIKKSELSYAINPRGDELPILTDAYISEKRIKIEKFVTNNWSTDFENLSFLVAQNGQIIYEKYEGFADKENNILNSQEIPLHIASVSKVITACAILKLIDEKKINLNDKLTSYFDGFPYEKVTIKTLLNHRSGIRKYGYFADDKANWDRRNTLTNQDVLTILTTKNIPLEYSTDKHFSYSNTNYVLLALVIEKVTGMKYSKAIQKMIFEPLDMKNSFVFDENTPKEKATPSYKYNYIKYSYDFLDDIYGDKNIYTTPRDLLKFNMAVTAPSFIHKELLNQVYKGYSYESKGEKNYGLGIRLREWQTGQKFYYHNGWWHGNTSSYNMLLKENVLIIALSNKFTKKTYQVNKLATLFGNYPFKLKESDTE